MKKNWLTIVAVVLAAAATSALANDEGLYLGGSAGYSQFKNSCKNLVAPCDGNDGAWRAFGGYQFSRYVGLEVGFANLGEAKVEGVNAFGVPGSATFAVEEAWDLSLMISFPLSTRLFGLLRLGAYRARTTVDDTTIPAHEGGTNGGFTLGLGAEYRLGPIGVRAVKKREPEYNVPS